MRFETEVEIDASRDRVRDALIDVERWPQWTESINEVTLEGGRLVVGARARIRQPRMPLLVWVVTRLQAGKAFDWQTSSAGVTTTGIHELEPLGDDRTLLRLSVEQSGVLSGLIGVLTGSRTRRYIELEARGLKCAAEAATAVS